MRRNADRSGAGEAAIVSAPDDTLLATIVELVNRVYADAEKGLWRDDAGRTNAGEIAAMAHAGQLVVARLDGQPVGTVGIQKIDPGVGEFGMLVASPEHRGVGIGRTLVAFAESWARREGRGEMQLELLVPQTWTHPVKEFLRGWYTRMGYRQVRTDRVADAYPALEPRLATPCDFHIFRKDL